MGRELERDGGVKVEIRLIGRRRRGNTSWNGERREREGTISSSSSSCEAEDEESEGRSTKSKDRMEARASSLTHLNCQLFCFSFSMRTTEPSVNVKMTAGTAEGMEGLPKSRKERERAPLSLKEERVVVIE
jgi:hypothetical protein